MKIIVYHLDGITRNQTLILVEACPFFFSGADSPFFWGGGLNIFIRGRIKGREKKFCGITEKRGGAEYIITTKERLVLTSAPCAPN